MIKLAGSGRSLTLITGIADCCARRERPRAAAPPSSVMNSRRLIRSPRRHGRAARRHGEAEHPGGLGVDDELELARLQDRQVRRLRALKDAAGIDADLTKRIRNARAVTHQSAGFDKFAPRIYRGNPVARRQVSQLDTPADEKGVPADEKCIRALAHKDCEGRVDLAAGAGVEDMNLQPHGAGSRFHVSQSCLGNRHRPD